MLLCAQWPKVRSPPLIELEHSMTPAHKLPAALALSFCFTAGAALAQSVNVLRPSGTYIQAASGMAFPESVGDFVRVSVIRYRSDGTDESAGYNRFEPAHEIVGTVYVFPSPPLISIGSPQNVIDGARAHLCDTQFRGIQKEVTTAHPDAELLNEQETSLLENGTTFTGHRATYGLTLANFMGRRQKTHSDAYLFCYVGGKWSVEYRFDYPDEYDPGTIISNFMHDLVWTIGD